MKFFVAFAAAAFLVAHPAAAQKAKPVVAVMEIEDLTSGDHSQTLQTMIESAVAGTGKFRVMERQRLGTLVGEQVRAKGGVVTSNTPGQTGGFEGVDYLIYGTITAISARNANDVGTSLVAGLLGNKGANCSNRVATMALDVKITDAASGEIRYVKSLNETLKSATSCSGAASVDVPKLLRSAADNVATGLVTTIYPIQVASVQGDGALILNYGEGAVQTGNIMAVYAKGEDIRDPSTGEVIGNNETRLGYVRVSEVMGRMSKASPASAFAHPVQIGAIVREASADEVKQLAKAGKRK